jgi:hypothetical protein
MINKAYLEVMQTILEDLKSNKPSFKEKSPQEYFYNLKLKNPKRYEGLNFSEKTKVKDPFSKDLSTIFSHLRFCGFLDLDNNILFE